MLAVVAFPTPTRTAVNANVMRIKQVVFLRWVIAILLVAFKPIILMKPVFRDGILIETQDTAMAPTERKIYKHASHT